MTLAHTTFDGGTEGAVITMASTATGSGDPLTGVDPQPTSGNRYVFAADAAVVGAFGAKRLLDATAGYVRRDVIGTPAGRTGSGAWIYIEDPTPGADMVLIQNRDSADGLHCNIVLRSNGNLCYAPSGTLVTTAGRFLAALPGAGWFHFEDWITPGASNTTGIVQTVVRDIDWTTLWDYTSPADANLGRTTPVARTRFTGFSNTSGFTYARLDEPRVESDRATGIFDEILPPVGPSAFYYSPDGVTSVPMELYYSPDGITSVRIDLA